MQNPIAALTAFRAKVQALHAEAMVLDIEHGMDADGAFEDAARGLADTLADVDRALTSPALAMAAE